MRDEIQSRMARGRVGTASGCPRLADCHCHCVCDLRGSKQPHRLLILINLVLDGRCHCHCHHHRHRHRHRHRRRDGASSCGVRTEIHWACLSSHRPMPSSIPSSSSQASMHALIIQIPSSPSGRRGEGKQVVHSAPVAMILSLP
jgi:hypothetical protein